MSFIITSDQITVFSDAGPTTAMRCNISEQDWASVLEALNDADYNTAAELITPRKQLEMFFDGAENLEIRDGKLWLNGQVVDTYPAHRAIEFYREGLPYKPVLAFIERVHKNPSYRAVQDLYQFLEAAQLPITPDGHFLAYKKVRRKDDQAGFVDIYTGTISNNPSDVVEMPRNQVNEDPDQTCSRGLHVCSHAYLPHFGIGSANAVVVVEIDPADVVAIPRDYDNAKMRVCRYKVVRVLEEWTRDTGNIFAGQNLVDDEAGDEIEEEIEEELEEEFGWITHNGGYIPPAVPDAKRISVRHADGSVFIDTVYNVVFVSECKQWLWEDCDPGDRITGYRIED